MHGNGFAMTSSIWIRNRAGEHTLTHGKTSPTAVVPFWVSFVAPIDPQDNELSPLPSQAEVLVRDRHSSGVEFHDVGGREVRLLDPHKLASRYFCRRYFLSHHQEDADASNRPVVGSSLRRWGSFAGCMMGQKGPCMQLLSQASRSALQCNA